MEKGNLTLIKCVEDIEITNLNAEFYKDFFYNALLNKNYYIIDRNHQPILIEKNIFEKHFKIN